MPFPSTVVASLISLVLAAGPASVDGALPDSIKADEPAGSGQRIESTVTFMEQATDDIWHGNALALVPVVSGDEELDAYLDFILDDLVGRDEDSLRRAYEWIGSEEAFPYLTMRHISPNEPWEEWSVSCAIQMASMGQGNCYRYASLMCWIARALGYDARTVSGYILHTKGWADHGWVEVVVDGETLIIDPQQHARGWNEGLDFFLVSYEDAPAFYTTHYQTVTGRYEME